MSKQKRARLADVMGLLNRICPPALAEDWDNVGLQVGDPLAEIDKILVCLDAEQIAVDAAMQHGAQLIVSHHPLLFRSLKRISPTDMTGRVLFSAIQNNIAIASLHTNLDRGADGLNDWLAERLHLSDCVPLEAPAMDQFVKLVVFVPCGYEDAVKEALFAAGAGQIGAYDKCSFQVTGCGGFRAGDQSSPFIGEPGVYEETQEQRIETLVPKPLVSKVLQRMLKVHPYEEVAYDLYPVSYPTSGIGLGRIGSLAETCSLADFALEVKRCLQTPCVRIVGDPVRQVRKVAVCGGSGMSVFQDAVRMGADCLVTGDVKFHEAQRARSEGLALIDAGHFATERMMIAELARRLRDVTAEQRFSIEIFEMTGEEDPFTTIF